MRLLLALTLADLATLVLLVDRFGIAGEVNPLIRALWALSPLIVLAYKVGSATVLGAIAQALGPRGHIFVLVGSLALSFGVGCNVASLVGSVC